MAEAHRSARPAAPPPCPGGSGKSPAAALSSGRFGNRPFSRAFASEKVGENAPRGRAGRRDAFTPSLSGAAGEFPGRRRPLSDVRRGSAHAAKAADERLRISTKTDKFTALSDKYAAVFHPFDALFCSPIRRLLSLPWAHPSRVRNVSQAGPLPQPQMRADAGRCARGSFRGVEKARFFGEKPLFRDDPRPSGEAFARFSGATRRLLAG